VSPRWANSIFAEQEDRAPVLMKACSHEGWDPCPASRGAAGSTPWRPDRGHQVQPRTCPAPAGAATAAALYGCASSPRHLSANRHTHSDTVHAFRLSLHEPSRPASWAPGEGQRRPIQAHSRPVQRPQNTELTRYPRVSPQKLFTLLSTGAERLFTCPFLVGRRGRSPLRTGCLTSHPPCQRHVLDPD